MSKRKVTLHVGDNDPWIDIRRSSQDNRRDPDEDWGTVIGIVLFVVFLAWLLS